MGTKGSNYPAEVCMKYTPELSQSGNRGLRCREHSDRDARRKGSACELEECRRHDALTPTIRVSVCFSDKEITLTGDKEPYLLGLVVNQAGKPVRTPTEAEQFAESLCPKARPGQSSRRTVSKPHISSTSHGDQFLAQTGREISHRGRAVRRAVPDQSESRVLRLSAQSNFNPFAVSSAPPTG